LCSISLTTTAIMANLSKDEECFKVMKRKILIWGKPWWRYNRRSNKCTRISVTYFKYKRNIKKKSIIHTVTPDR
jgi:hypothetical protein